MVFSFTVCHRAERVDITHQAQAGKPKEGILRPWGGRHPQVTKLNITLSLNKERLNRAKDRGRQEKARQRLDSQQEFFL